MRKIIAFFLIALIFVSGCQPSESVVQTAMAQTQVAMPTATPDYEGYRKRLKPR